VIGYEDDMKNWKQADLERYFKTYYAPNNCVVVVTGAVKTGEIKKLAEQYLEPIPAQPEPPRVHSTEPPQTGERRIILKKDVATPYLYVAYRAPEARHEDYYALSLLSDVLSSGKSSRLYSSLVDQKQLATAVFTSYDEAFDPTIMGFYAVTNKGSSEKDLENALFEEIEKIKTGTYELFFGDFKKMFEAPAEFDKVTAADIKRVAAKYLVKSGRTVGLLTSKTDD
jgi:predicted Zn-dependent peptidase